MSKHRTLSHSARETFKGCNKAYFYQREMRLEPLEKKKSLRMGTAFGGCIEHRDPERAAEGYFEGVAMADRLMDHDAIVEIAQVQLLAELYCERYPDHQKYDVVEHEVEFRHPILGHGFLDGVFEINGERIGMEGKLLQKGLFWNDAARQALAIDDQVTAYFAAMREIGRPLDKLLYRVAFKPGIKPDSRKKYPDGRKGERLDDYLARLRARIEAEPDYAFEQHELYRTDDQIDRFLEECGDVNAQVRLARRRGAWPKNTKNCTAFGGCAFLPVCREETGLEDRFRIKPKPAPPMRMPRIGKVQKLALLVMGDAFTEWVELEDLGKQVYDQTPSSIHKAVTALVARNFLERIGEEGDDPLTRRAYRLTNTGKQVVELLRTAASDPAG